MNDDYQRKEYWGDPQKALMKQEEFSAGCRACLRSVYNKSKLSWHCEAKIGGYPYMTKDDCDLWARKKW